MKVAVAGTGNVAQYLFEEIRSYGHDLVILTRRAKVNEQGFEQRETNYSVESLIDVLKDVDALVSTIADFANPSAVTEIHFNMLDAVKRSDKTTMFIPSEWTGNVEDYPEQPMFLADSNKALHEVLKKEKDVKWTIISNSWFADYVIPARQRYLRDLGALWPMDWENKVFTIYGPGTQMFDVVSVRDVAKAVAVLLGSDQAWEPYTYVSGQHLSWNDLYAIVKRNDPEWTSCNKPLADTINQIVANQSPEEVMVAHFEILAYAGALDLPPEKVQRHRAKHFKDIHFRTVEEIIDEAAARPNEVI